MAVLGASSEANECSILMICTAHSRLVQWPLLLCHLSFECRPGPSRSTRKPVAPTGPTRLARGLASISTSTHPVHEAFLLARPLHSDVTGGSARSGRATKVSR